MFKGMRNLESQSFGGDLGPAECEEWALQGHARGNARDDFDPMLHDPVGSQASVSGSCWSRLPSHSHRVPDHTAEGTAGWGIPMLEPSSNLLPPEAFQHSIPTLQQPKSSHRCLPSCPSLAALPALTAAEVQPDESSDWPDPQSLLCAFCCNKRNSLKQ